MQMYAVNNNYRILLLTGGRFESFRCLRLNLTSLRRSRRVNVNSTRSFWLDHSTKKETRTGRWIAPSITARKTRIFSQSISVTGIQVTVSSFSCSPPAGTGSPARSSASYQLRSNAVTSSTSWGHFDSKLKQPWQAGSCRGSTLIASSEEKETMGSGEVPLRSYQIVVAASQNLGIGKDGDLPWILPTDMKFFRDVTTQTRSLSKRNAVIMGRLSWDAIPKSFRPLKGRLNVILSRTLKQEDFHDSALVCESVYKALTLLATPQYASDIETVFVIGGGQILSETMSGALCDAIHLTEIEADIECDAFSPPVDRSSFTPWYTSPPIVENNMRYSFVTYVRRGGSLTNVNVHQKAAASANGADDRSDCTSQFKEWVRDLASVLPPMILSRHEEYQYLNMVRDILQNGTVKGDRTGTGTRSRFGCQMRFNLRKSFPLLTTKRVHWRGVVEELLWFISGSTNAKDLQDRDVHIWDGNSTKEYLSSIGLAEREEGDLGPVYGFQWRHFGAKYTDMHADYSGQGFDQLADVIHKIRTNPDDRRIVLSAWNPADLHLMALPPCHMFAQFYVANGELSCQMYQRSCDMGLGVPYNIASYSLLTYMIAHICDLVPGDFVHVLGDAHVYLNHVEPLEQQLKNIPKPFPVLKIKTSKREIDSFTADDFELVGYQSSGRIAMKMAI